MLNRFLSLVTQRPAVAAAAWVYSAAPTATMPRQAAIRPCAAWAVEAYPRVSSGPFRPVPTGHLAQRRRVVGLREIAVQDTVDGELGQQDVGRDAGQVEHERLEAPPPGACFGDLVVDNVQIAPQQVDLRSSICSQAPP